MIFILIFVDDCLYFDDNMLFQYGWEPVLVHRILIVFVAIQEKDSCVQVLEKSINTYFLFLIYMKTLKLSDLSQYSIHFHVINLKCQYEISGREGTLGCLLHQAPKFHNNVSLFFAITTLGTFIEFWLNVSTTNCNLEKV